MRLDPHQDDGKVFYRVTEAVAADACAWCPIRGSRSTARVEIDRLDAADRRHVATASMSPAGSSNPGDIGRMRSKFNGKFWWDMTEQEHQAIPRRLRGAGRPGRRSRCIRKSISARATAAS